MKIRRLLGLAAVGGGIYWMQKKRGGDMSFASIKESFRGVVDDLLNKANIKRSDEQRASASSSRPAYGATGAYTGSADYGGSSYRGGSGYTGSGSFGGRGGIGGTGGNGGTRH